ncbi:MAG: monovalent cation/H+ antiporter subunit A [Burkholderiaceae bacterium]
MISLPIILLLPIVAGIPLAAWTPRALGRGPALVAVGMVVGCALILLLSTAGTIMNGGVLTWSLDWMPESGINWSLRLDALGFLFCFLILGIGLLIVTYARFYLHDHDPLDKFYVTLMVFMTAMLGIALSDNLIALVVFWELTSLSSFFLIGYWSHNADSRRSARVALAVTGGGGLALIAGAVLLAQIGGSYDISALVLQHDKIINDPRFTWALVLVLLGAFTKSAQYPFHFWLPAAMAAPTPVSAYLHSATMVKAGLLLVAKLHPVIGGNDLFVALVAGSGLITLVLAAGTAVFKHDLKGLLAYSTISHLGIIMFLLGLSTPLASVAAVFHILNHAAFKAALFMSAGIVDHEAGTRDIRRLGGLAKLMPVTTALATLAAAAMAGLPPFNGFISKEMFFERALHIEGHSWLATLAPWLVVLGGAFSVAYSVRYIHDAFFNGEPRDVPGKPHDPPLGMRGPVMLLVFVCIAVGLLPALIAQPLVYQAAQAITGPTMVVPEFHLSLWHGFNLPLLMSAFAVVGGLLIYGLLQFRMNLHGINDDKVSARRAFETAINRVIVRAARATAAIDKGSLQRTMGLIFGFLLIGPVLVLMAGPVSNSGGVGFGNLPHLPTDMLAWVVWAMTIAGAMGTVIWRRDHVKMVIAGAVVGLGMVLAFFRFSAPDLALTQLSVEVVSTILLFMGLALLPRSSQLLNRHPVRKALHVATASFCGLGIGWLAYAGMTRDPSSISWFFIDRSYVEGGGKNVVNVILVDFRGFDTLGEIAVLAIAALGVFALLDGIRVSRRQQPDEGGTWVGEAFPLMLRVVAGWLAPLALLVGLYIFLRGHNAPGGGFIAGLIVSVALLIQYMAFGMKRGESLLPIRYDRVAGVGLIIAAATGLGSFMLGYPFLTSYTGHPVLPVLGEVGLATAAIFDVGVFLVVVGSTLLTVMTLARVSNATPSARSNGSGGPGQTDSPPAPVSPTAPEPR